MMTPFQICFLILHTLSLSLQRFLFRPISINPTRSKENNSIHYEYLSIPRAHNEFDDCASIVLGSTISVFACQLFYFLLGVRLMLTLYNPRTICA